MLAFYHKIQYLFFDLVLRLELVQLKIPESRVKFSIGKSYVCFVCLAFEKSCTRCFVDDCLWNAELFS